MIINPFDISNEALTGIVKENILRGAEGFDGDNIDKEIDNIKRKVLTRELTMIFSQAKNNVTLVDSKLLKK